MQVVQAPAGGSWFNELYQGMPSMADMVDPDKVESVARIRDLLNVYFTSTVDGRRIAQNSLAKPKEISLDSRILIDALDTKVSSDFEFYCNALQIDSNGSIHAVIRAHTKPNMEDVAVEFGMAYVSRTINIYHLHSVVIKYLELVTQCVVDNSVKSNTKHK